MKFLIDVDLPEDVLKEWEPVAFRRSERGDAYITEDGGVLHRSSGIAGCRLILHRRFQWPAWLKCRYLTWGSSGHAFGWFARPEMSDRGWVTTCDAGCDSGYPLWRQCIELPFPGGDWRTRIEENPIWKPSACATS